MNRCLLLAFRATIVVTICVGALCALGTEAYAGALRIALATLQPQSGDEDARQLARLLINDFLPYSLGKKFVTHFGLAPQVAVISEAEARQAIDSYASGSTTIFDILIVPEIRQYEGQQVIQFRVSDFRGKLLQWDGARTFAAVPTEPGTIALQAALDAAADRIVDAILGQGVVSNRGPIKDSGLVQVWCIIPTDPAKSFQTLSADLTINLTNELAMVAKDTAPGFNFIGLGQRDYLYQCKSVENGSEPIGPGKRGVDAMYILSGQLGPSPSTAGLPNAVLRLFVEDRGVGRTYPLAPVRFDATSQTLDAGLQEDTYRKISKEIIDNLQTALDRGRKE